jgi:hypothetical protein
MAFLPHRYDAPYLEASVKKAYQLYSELSAILHDIQEATSIPGLHTDINSNDETEGVLQRIQVMHEEGDDSLESFKRFDDN